MRPAARRTAMSAVGLLVASTLTAGWASTATADPVYPSAGEVAQAQGAVRSASASVAGLEAQLAVSSARLEDLQTQVQIAAEAYDVAQVELAERAKAAAAARAQAGSAAAKAAQAQDDVGQLAVDTYVKGQNFGGLEVLVGSTTAKDLVDTASGVQIAANLTHQTLQRADASKVVATLMRREADLALAQQEAAAAKVERARVAVEARAASAQAETARIQASRGQMISRLAVLRKTSVTLETQRQAGLEEVARQRAEAARREAARKAAVAAQAEQARQAAAAREQARRDAAKAAQTKPHKASKPSGGSSSGGSSSGGSSSSGSSSGGSSSGSSSSGSSSGGSSSGSSSAGRRAVEFAKSQIGKNYQWGADGPSTYDCSGLVLKAWAQSGVYLPHSSRMQYQVTKHVSYSDLRPGDLVFFGTSSSNPDSIHHVGMYIGGGEMVEAPYTGAQVRIRSIYRSGMMPYAGRP